MILYILLCISIISALAAALRHDVQMFQQNSYRYSRYFRWLKGNFASAEALKFAILLITSGVGMVISSAFGDTCSYLHIATMICGFSIYSIYEFRKKFKVKISYTSRVKRLLLTASVLSLALISTVYIYFDLKWALSCFAGIILFSSPIMLIANLINTPIEKAITQWYINDARKIITSRKDLIIIGVTGSYGKTSTKNYLYRMLTEKYNVLVTPGNYNTLLGVVRTIRENLRPQHQIFIVEMGAKQPGDIKEICDLVHPKIGIVTSVGEAHLEMFKSIENTKKTKFELIDSLPKDGFGVINLDSENIKNHNFTSKCPIISYSIDEPKANAKAYNVSYNASGVSFSMNIDGEQVDFKSPLLGGGNILNLVAGITVASSLEVSTSQLQRALQQLHPVEHRLSMSRSGGLIILDDAYNSNPTGAKMALDVLRTFTLSQGAKRIIITPGFVEMGTAQAEANYTLGCQIAASADYAIVVNMLNRDAIVRGLKDSNFPEDKYFIADSLNQARAHLAPRLAVGDVILYENDLPDSFK